MLSSKSYASLFDSSLNSPSLPRTPPTPWTLADESCCSESDPLVISSHRGPGYHICMKEVSQWSVWDSHCHLDFLARKLNQVNIKGGESLVKSLQSDGQNLGDRFGGCIANFCHPRDWGQGASKVLSSCKSQNRVFLTLGCHREQGERGEGRHWIAYLKVQNIWWKTDSASAHILQGDPFQQQINPTLSQRGFTLDVLLFGQ